LACAHHHYQIVLQPIDRQFGFKIFSKGNPFRIKGKTFSAKEKLPNIIFKPPNAFENAVLAHRPKKSKKSRCTIGVRGFQRAKQHGTPNARILDENVSPGSRWLS
jgi:hypothetical protein